MTYNLRSVLSKKCLKICVLMYFISLLVLELTIMERTLEIALKFDQISRDGISIRLRKLFGLIIHYTPYSFFFFFVIMDE